MLVGYCINLAHVAWISRARYLYLQVAFSIFLSAYNSDLLSDILPKHHTTFRKRRPMKIEARLFAAVCCCSLLIACRIGGPATAPVTVTVSAPENNTTVSYGKSIQVLVSATAPAGVARVELSVNGTLVAVSNNTQETDSYQTIIYYTPLIDGPLNLIARAYDKNDASSIPVGITLLSSHQTSAPDPVRLVNTPNSPYGSTPTPPAGTSTTLDGALGLDGCTLNVQFIADVTVPDGTAIPLQSSFTKIWRVRNTGTCTWDSSYKLIFGSGNQLGGPASVPVGIAKPNEVIDISVPLQAPSSGSGEISAEWRFAAPNNVIFGNALTVVIALPAPTPLPTVPPTLTPTQPIEFSAATTSISRGSCTVLHWATTEVAGVFLSDVAVSSVSQKDVCPTEVTTYTLSVNSNDGSNTSRVIVIDVTPGELIYSFADNASSAHWYNDSNELIFFGGSESKALGYATSRDGLTLEDSSLQLKVIETHPRLEASGAIYGDFSVPVELKSGDQLLTRIGFLKGATAGSVTLRVFFNNTVIAEKAKVYDGTLLDWNINLSRYVGQTGIFTIEAVGIPTTTQAAICWINPRIER